MEGMDNDANRINQTRETTIKNEGIKVESPLRVEGVQVEVVPLTSDLFGVTADPTSLTPMKLVTTVFAQHLLKSLESIPIAGNTLQDTLDMLNGIVKEFNKSAQIIKLTTEYVNISSHYILSTLNQYEKNSCEYNKIEQSVKSIREKFFLTVSRHIKGAVKGLKEKTKGREMSGSDILVSAAYHIVSAFQEMTNQVLKLDSESINSCRSPPPSIEITPASAEKKANNDVFNFQVVPQQGNPHKSIKKDQADVPMTDNKVTFVDLWKIHDNQLTLENINSNPDLTVELFSPLKTDKKEAEQLIKEENNKLKVPEDSKLHYAPFTTSFNLNKEEFGSKKEMPGKSTYIDKDLASSAVDSLSNVPSAENAFHVHEARTQCTETVEPVCGIDRNSKKFIIFLNDCKREAHNKMHSTSYEWFRMDVCVGLFMKNPAFRSPLLSSDDVNLHPR